MSDNEELALLRKIARGFIDLQCAESNPEFTKFCGGSEKELKQQLVDSAVRYEREYYGGE